MEDIISKVTHILTVYGLNVVSAFFIFFVGKWAAGKISTLIERALLRAKVDETLAGFSRHFSYFGIFIFVVIASLAKLGIQTASFIAVLGAAGLAVGLALQGSLSNFAAGVLILVLRPFKTGDVITIAGITGKVREIQIFTTVLNSGDNVQHIIPNSQALGGTISNFTANDKRRVDLVIGVSYEDDLQKTKKVLSGVVMADEGVLRDPAPVIAVGDLGESSVNFYVRPWVKSSDYWDVRFRLIEKIKESLDRNGITIPFPQRDVHLKTESSVLPLKAGA